MLGQRRANAHTLGGVGPCGAGDPGGRGGRALRARWRTDARFARARRLRRRQGRGAKGPRGALGFFRWLAEWKGIQRGNALEIVFTSLLLCLMRGFASGEICLWVLTLYLFYSGESLPLGIIWGRQGFESSRLT